MSLLQRTSTVDELVESVTEQILLGRLEPGTRLREAEFANRYDVSRNTLREALHRLARDGLVVHRPHRGVAVARPSCDDVREIFRVRYVLEGAGIEAIDETGAHDMNRIARSMESAAAARNWTRLVDLDLEFHARLISSLGSSKLDEFFGSLLRELRLSFVLIDSAPGGMTGPSHVPDHTLIATDLLEERKKAAAKRLVAHLLDAENLVITHLSEEER